MAAKAKKGGAPKSRYPKGSVGEYLMRDDLDEVIETLQARRRRGALPDKGRKATEQRMMLAADARQRKR